ncbi:MAG: 4Fe-4S dicluster domain-containing protein [Syntrophobacteraceae bacterium]
MDQTRAVLKMDGQLNAWGEAVSTETGICASSCYRCMRCTNGCPVSSFMDLKPHQVVRLVQLGQKEKLLECNAIWICVGCEMCSTYCPNKINVAGLMDHLKSLVVNEAKKPAAYDIAVFHTTFLDIVQQYGRLNDLQLLQRYKIKTVLHDGLPPLKELCNDMLLAWELLKRGRLSLLPESSPASGEVKRIFKQFGSKEVTG